MSKSDIYIGWFCEVVSVEISFMVCEHRRL